MWERLHVKYQLFFSDSVEAWIFVTDFLKKPQMAIYKKLPAVGAELFHADGRTDMTKLIVAFRNSGKADVN
jgi:hypothetical protein